MILAQGWKDQKVYALVLSRATHDLNGWQIYLGVYDQKLGGTFETSEWECLGSSRNLIELLYYHVVPEITTWADGSKQIKGLQDTLIAIHDQCKQIATYVEAACAVPSP